MGTGPKFSEVQRRRNWQEEILLEKLDVCRVVSMNFIVGGGVD
jgi:hypothetical protein